jgi:predicted nucleic acid-binding protein
VKRIVVDASVAIKWLVPFRPEEADIGKALALFEQIARQDRVMVQPPHFVAEVMTVIARLEPDYADRVSSLPMKPTTAKRKELVKLCACRITPNE